MASKNRLSVNLSNEEYQELVNLSKKHRVSMAWLGRQAIVRFLEQKDRLEFHPPLSFLSQTGTD